MLANLEALAALADAGTMTRAARRLRVTQSAVSKRIAALERDLGTELTEPDGRNVKLTPAGRELLERVSPLLVELRHALGGTRAEAGGALTLGVAHSVLASWGPRAISRALRQLPGLELAIHSHRSTVAVDRVRAGEYQLALAAGALEADPDLAHHPLGAEPMVIVPSGKKPVLKKGVTVDVLTIETASHTWPSLAPALAALRRTRAIDLRPTQTVETFACAVQMARVGFGHALVPAGIARVYGVRHKDMIYLPAPGISRPISLVGRRMTLSRKVASAFVTAMALAVGRELELLGADV